MQRGAAEQAPLKPAKKFRFRAPEVARPLQPAGNVHKKRIFGDGVGVNPTQCEPNTVQRCSVPWQIAPSAAAHRLVTLQQEEKRSFPCPLPPQPCSVSVLLL